jgi:hypothetical protein
MDEPKDVPVGHLADSEDTKLVEARAALIKAQTALENARAPLVDKLILRGLIPIALAIIGPWALWQFQSTEEKVKQQAALVKELHDLVEKESEDQKRREARELKLQEKEQRIEEERAAEIATLSAMVIRLDSTLRVFVIQSALSRELLNNGRVIPPAGAKRDKLVKEIAKQLSLPGVGNEEVERLIYQALDKEQNSQEKD